MKPLLCFDLWKTLAQEPLSSRNYFAPLFSKYPAADRAQVSALVDEIIMRAPMDLTEGIHAILQRLAINEKDMPEKIAARWKSSCENAKLFPDVIVCLTQLRAQFSLALITNTSQYGWNQIESKYALSRYFDAVFLSFGQGMTKPDPRLFQYAATQAGTKPNECTMIGDSEILDLAPARALGWRAIRIQRPCLCQDDAPISDLQPSIPCIKTLYPLCTNVLIH